MRRSFGRLYVSHWEPELLDGSGYLSGSVELDSPRLLVHIVATTRGPGPRIVHGGFEGGLSRAMIDLPPGPGAARPSFVSDAPPSWDPLAPPPREAQIGSAAGDAPADPQRVA